MHKTLATMSQSALAVGCDGHLIAQEKAHVLAMRCNRAAVQDRGVITALGQWHAAIGSVQPRRRQHEQQAEIG